MPQVCLVIAVPSNARPSPCLDNNSLHPLPSKLPPSSTPQAGPMESDPIDPSPAYASVLTSAPTSLEDFSITSSAPSVSTSLSLTPGHIKAHLRLLRAFQALKWRVQNPDSYPEVASKIPPRARSLNQKGRWIWFLQLAVERCAHPPRHSSAGLCM